MDKIAAVILAAGKGTRMGNQNGSEIPKVMFLANKKPLIGYCVDNIQKSGINKIVLVVGYKKEMVEDFLGNKVEYAIQEEQLGTGHAAMMARPNLKDKSEAVLICYGDMPLYKSETIQKLIAEYEKEKPTIAMLSVNFENPNFWAYGRIVRDGKNDVVGIVEQKDCTEKEKNIKECNPGFYIFDSKWLWDNFEKIKSNNAQNEYYLTDMIKIAKDQGKKIIAIPVEEESEALGINTQEQLKKAEEILNQRETQSADFMAEAKKMFAGSKGCHDWDHTERVLNLCLHIGKNEGANLKILSSAAILHDIGRDEEEKSGHKIDHAEYGATKAKTILEKYSFSDEEIDKITSCIRTHRFKGKNIPESLEAKILYDADKLDAIGAIGIGRAFVFSGEMGARVHSPEITLENSSEYSRDDTAYRHYLDKLCKIKDKLLTIDGKKIAQGRQEFMEEFFSRLNNETLGLS